VVGPAASADQDFLPKLPCPDQNSGQPDRLSGKHVSLQIVPHHQRPLGRDAEEGHGLAEDLRGRLPHDDRSDPGCFLEGRHIRPRVELGSFRGHPPNVAVHGHPGSALSEHPEGFVHGFVCEGVLGAGHDDDVSAVVDQVDAVEVFGDVARGEEEAPGSRMMGAQVGGGGR
jgi:hypothetical protein